MAAKKLILLTSVLLDVVLLLSCEREMIAPIDTMPRFNLQNVSQSGNTVTLMADVSVVLPDNHYYSYGFEVSGNADMSGCECILGENQSIVGGKLIYSASYSLSNWTGQTLFYRAFICRSDRDDPLYSDCESIDVTVYSIKHEWVDLGLSVRWATCNLGASSPSDLGDYFAWGEITPKSSYSWTNYRFCVSGSTDKDVTFSKYNTKRDGGVVDNKIRLDPFDDAARANWGEGWRIPTMAEWDELNNNCSWTLKTENGIEGFEIKGPNGNSIFLPYTGKNGWTVSVPSGHYWSSSQSYNWMGNNHLYSGLASCYYYFRTSAGIFSFYVDGRHGDEGSRSDGYQVRPVSDSVGETTVPVSSVSMNVGSLTLERDEYFSLVATIQPQTATDKYITWRSSDISVATVSDGKVMAISKGTATITASVGDHVASCVVMVKNTTNGSDNGHEWVDLGLSVKWATCNMGASFPSEEGDYYSWGETMTKDSYIWEKYQFRVSGEKYIDVTFSKYNTKSDRGTVDNKTILDLSDDAAHVNWGGGWRIPTKDEWEELKSKCTWTWVTPILIKGCKVTGPNGKSIFLPAQGLLYGDTYNGLGARGCYWSSSLDIEYPQESYRMQFGADYSYCSSDDRFFGMTVRPVTN